MTKRSTWWLGGIVVLLLMAALAAPSVPFGRLSFFPDGRLGGVRNWHYQLQSLDLDRLARNDADLLVIDFSQSQPAGRPMRPLERAEVERLKRRADGSRRLVVAYLSIGEAEEYRYYWRPEWWQSPPEWIISENCRWPRNHLVRFWHPGWRDIIFAGPASYLARIAAAGFDGIYIDRIDIYYDIKDRFPEARAEMIQFMRDLAGAARRLDPAFKVIAQNAEDLLSDVTYRRAIDALAKEDLLYGVDGTAKRNSAELIQWSVRQLQYVQRQGGLVLAVEYLSDPKQIASASRELADLGVISTFAPRALDGRDPTAPAPPAVAGEAAYGTPEYAASRCDGVFPRS
jgi:cysteinyl-tRNA synthetase